MWGKIAKLRHYNPIVYVVGQLRFEVMFSFDAERQNMPEKDAVEKRQQMLLTQASARRKRKR